jgi:hypothetical protein
VHTPAVVATAEPGPPAETPQAALERSGSAAAVDAGAATADADTAAADSGSDDEHEEADGLLQPVALDEDATVAVAAPTAAVTQTEASLAAALYLRRTASMKAKDAAAAAAAPASATATETAAKQSSGKTKSATKAATKGATKAAAAAAAVKLAPAEPLEVPTVWDPVLAGSLDDVVAEVARGADIDEQVCVCVFTPAVSLFFS